MPIENTNQIANVINNNDLVFSQCFCAFDILNANLLADGEDRQEMPATSAERKRDNRTRTLTAMTGAACVVAVMAMIVALVAVSQKDGSHNSAQSSGSSGMNTQAVLSDMQSEKVKTNAARMITSHPFCKLSVSHWANCGQLVDRVEGLVHEITTSQPSATELASTISAGALGDNLFIVNNGSFAAASPNLPIASKLGQPHQLANTSQCEWFSSHGICVAFFQNAAAANSSSDQGKSTIAVFIHNNVESQMGRRRDRRHGHGGGGRGGGGLGSRLSSNWHGSWSGAGNGDAAKLPCAGL
jgi:hypothetical protein